jgi:hypothetical protein
MRYIKLTQNVTVLCCYSSVYTYTLRVTRAHTHPVTASNGRCSLPLGVPTVTVPQHQQYRLTPSTYSNARHHLIPISCFSDWRLRVQVMCPPTVSRPVYLGVEHSFVAHAQIFIAVARLRLSCCGQSPWWEDRSVIDSSSLVTVSLEALPTWRARSSNLYPPGRVWTNYTPWHRVTNMNGHVPYVYTIAAGPHREHSFL